MEKIEDIVINLKIVIKYMNGQWTASSKPILGVGFGKDPDEALSNLFEDLCCRKKWVWVK